MAEMTDQCARPACHCPARMDIEYCSEYCEQAKDDDEIGCRCGHADCYAFACTAGISLQPLVSRQSSLS